MLDQIQDAIKKRPGLGIARRSSFLVAASGPYHGNDIATRIKGVPLANLALASVTHTFYVAMTAVPQLAIEQASDSSLGGKPGSPAEVANRRKVLLAGNAATIVAGVLAQRAVTHSGRQGTLLDLVRIASTQLAIGGAAGAIVTGSDIVLGPIARRKDQDSPATLALAAGIISVNRMLLRKSATVLTLPTQPAPNSYVVRAEPG